MHSFAWNGLTCELNAFLDELPKLRKFVFSRRQLREDIGTKKTFSFGHCPNHLNPPPPDPNSGNLVLFFLRQKRRFARMTGKKIDADNEGCNDNYDKND